MKNVKLFSAENLVEEDGVMLHCCCLSLVGAENVEKVIWRDTGRGEKSHSVTLHAKNHPVSARNHSRKSCMLCKWLQQRTGERQLSLERRKIPQENPLAATSDCFYFCFCWFLVFFRYVEDATTVSSSLYCAQEPSEALMASERVPGTITPSRGARR